jgi:hypothetical protein
MDNARHETNRETLNMSIKSDKWIRRMATDHGMIEPFEPGQIKNVNGEKIVSYGTSSYGYDVRCANEFKLFTNINSTIVDPKHFDPIPASSRPTRSPWRAPLNTSAFRATCWWSAWAKAPMRAVASSST